MIEKRIARMIILNNSAHFWTSNVVTATKSRFHFDAEFQITSRESSRGADLAMFAQNYKFSIRKTSKKFTNLLHELAHAQMQKPNRNHVESSHNHSSSNSPS